MAIETTIEYYLPVTKVRLQATVTVTTDGLLTETVGGVEQPMTTRVAERTCTLVTVADSSRPRTLKVKGGLIRDYAFDLGLTEDGRLTGASIESTGHLGQVLTAAATLVGTAVALGTGNLPLAAILLGTAAGTGGQPAGTNEQPLGPGGQPLGTDDLSPEEKVWRAYVAARPAEAARLAALTLEHGTLVIELDTARQDLRVAVPDVPKMNLIHQTVATLQELLGANERERARAGRLFAAWRAGTLSTTAVVYDELVQVTSLPGLVNGALTFVNSDEGNRVQAFFTGALGVVALGDKSPAVVKAPVTDDVLHVLRPRQVTLVHVEGSTGSPTVLSTERALVMDRSCEHLSISVRRSKFGKRQTTVGLSEIGAPTKVTYGGAASVDAGMQALSGLPAAFGDALDTVASSRKTLDGLRDAPAERELAGLKRAVDLEEQRLKLAGQAATADDYAELQSLKQEKEIAELQAEVAKLRATA